MFIIDDIINAIGSAIASGQQKKSAEDAMGIQKDVWSQQRADQSPYLDAGTRGLASLYDLMRAPPTLNPSDISNSPAFQFRMQEGQKALERSAAARGGLNSGAFMKGLDRYSQGLASEEYGSEWNRRQADYSNRWNRLFGLAGMGQNSAQNLGALGGNYATNMAQLFGAKGNAEAAGTMGIANGAGGAVRSLGNLAMLGAGGAFGSLGGMAPTLVPTQGASMATGFMPSAGFSLPSLTFGRG